MKATQKQLKDKEAENANLRLVIQAIRDQIQHLQNEAQSSDERAVQAKNEVQRLNAKSRDAVKLVHAT
jgi:peptidoglycan hydrolase CwlO-like protein